MNGADAEAATPTLTLTPAPALYLFRHAETRSAQGLSRVTSRGKSVA